MMLRPTIAALTLASLVVGSVAAGAATGSSLLGTKMSAVSKARVLRRDPRPATCELPKQWIVQRIPRDCYPGEQPPGGLFGNRCFDNVQTCGSPTVVN
mgnify:CR=1 FL=1